jgi:hypothetical protein
VQAPPSRLGPHAARSDEAQPWSGVRALKRLLGRELPIETAEPRRLPPPAPANATRPLVLASGMDATPGHVEELSTWAGAQLAAPVLLTSVAALPALSRLGLHVELWNEPTAEDVADRLDFGAYRRLKLRALMAAYGCGPVVFWDEGAARDELSTQLLLGH